MPHPIEQEFIDLAEQYMQVPPDDDTTATLFKMVGIDTTVEFLESMDMISASNAQATLNEIQRGVPPAAAIDVCTLTAIAFGVLIAKKGLV